MDNYQNILKLVIPVDLVKIKTFSPELVLFSYERDFYVLSLSDNNQADVIEVFNFTSRYLDDLLDIDISSFEQTVGHIYPTEIELNRADSFDTKAPVLDLDKDITYLRIIYDKLDAFNFEIINFPFLDRDIPLFAYYGLLYIYISQLICLARVCSNVFYCV